MHADLIVPRLWLGDRIAAADTAWLAENKIDAVFNCTKDLPFAESPCRKYRLPVHDNLQEDEIDSMRDRGAEMVYNVLREYKAGSTILIHCAAGRQRSAALTAMFLIVTSAKPADYVMRYIKMQRPVAFSPAANFDRAIREFEARLQAAAVTVAAKKGS
jgi:predicted protein tyrosine phosphatase